MIPKLKRSSGKGAGSWLVKKILSMLKLLNCSLKSIMFLCLGLGFLTAFLVKLKTGRMPISTNNFCLLSRKRFWWIGSNTSAQPGILSVSGQSERRLKTSVERSHLKIGYRYSLAKTLTSNWESLQALILNEHRLSIYNMDEKGCQ